MRPKAPRFPPFLLFTFLLFIPIALHAESTVHIQAGGLRMAPSVKSFKDIRQSKLVRQGWDISCGAAALSTLLTYHLQRPFSEAAIVVTLLKNTDPERVRARGGFSLLDLKRFVEALGYEGKGYGELSLEDLVDFKVPAILPVRIRAYDHFVVFRGRIGNRVFLGDPAFGNLSLSLQAFSRIWKNGIGFIVVEAGETDRALTPLSPDAMELAVPDLKNLFQIIQRSRPVSETRRPLFPLP